MNAINYEKSNGIHKLIVDGTYYRGDFIIANDLNRLFSCEKFIIGYSGCPSIITAIHNMAEDLRIRADLLASDVKFYDEDEEGNQVEIPYTHETEITNESDIYRLLMSSMEKFPLLKCWGTEDIEMILCIKNSLRAYYISLEDSQITVIEIGAGETEFKLSCGPFHEGVKKELTCKTTGEIKYGEQGTEDSTDGGAQKERDSQSSPHKELP